MHIHVDTDDEKAAVTDLLVEVCERELWHHVRNSEAAKEFASDADIVVTDE